ncbi:hypothetical protein GV792_12970 [Nocardia cyriacigeorgica]|uniref:Uncharacterized protein n=1 Tax=Nocardia cyriacigeorgica TaxID=135487 RepID=A0A6P1D8S6_9NOCA|nr:hypothetical protein [Nocardia cyriacigeorgica]NEW45941.1 hypothetical protein [Nocardia cyriacigeorgica]NEW50971.1 hypothetical protein [Nocardia cyriacigeorgica]
MGERNWALWRLYRDDLGQPRIWPYLLAALVLIIAICGVCGLGLWGFNRVAGTTNGPGGVVDCPALSWDGQCTVTFDRRTDGATVQLAGRTVRLIGVSTETNSADFDTDSLLGWNDERFHLRVGEDYEFSGNTLELIQITPDKVILHYWPPADA